MPSYCARCGRRLGRVSMRLPGRRVVCCDCGAEAMYNMIERF
jgi:transposase